MCTNSQFSRCAVTLKFKWCERKLSASLSERKLRKFKLCHPNRCCSFFQFNEYFYSMLYKIHTYIYMLNSLCVQHNGIRISVRIESIVIHFLSERKKKIPVDTGERFNQIFYVYIMLNISPILWLYLVFLLNAAFVTKSMKT